MVLLQINSTLKIPNNGISRIAKVLSLTLSIICAAMISSPTHAAIQMGGHMDFILSTNKTVRVFPEAMNNAPSRPRSILPQRRRVSYKSPGTDSCANIKKQYDKHKSVRQSYLSKMFKKKRKISPKWLKKTKHIRNVSFRRQIFQNEQPKGWYYLPTEPQIAYKDNRPEATFLNFMTDEESSKGGAEGGIFHLMVTFGLTEFEEKELERLLKEAVPNAVLKGMVNLIPSQSKENFVVTSGTLSDTGFAPTGPLTSGYAPSFPGAKAALAGRLSDTGAQLMQATFENPTTDLSVTFVYDYIVKTMAYKAVVRIDMDLIQEATDCAVQTYSKKKSRGRRGIMGRGLNLLLGSGSKGKVTIDEQDLEESYESLINMGAITIDIDQNQPDIDVSIVEAGLMELAMSSFVSMQKSFESTSNKRAESSSQESETDKNSRKSREQARRRADSYQTYTLKRKKTRKTGSLTMTINKGIALYRTHTMTGNIGGFLREHKDEIFSEVILNDPFFKRGIITVDLDVEALDLFAANMINNVNVEVFVPFPENSFTDSDQFTRADLASGKITKTFTFASRGEDPLEKRCNYYYIESWSLRGGGKFPKNPKKECAKEMVVTLVPPIEKRSIDSEADLEEMKELGIRGIDVVLDYSLYGKSKKETIRFRVAKGEGYLDKTIFVDKSNPEVKYKVIISHKTKGKISSDWEVLEGDLIAANISALPVSAIDKIKQKIPEISELIDSVREL